MKTNNNIDVVKQNVLSVSFDYITNQYSVEIPKGGSVNETAFAVTVVVKCFLKAGHIKTAKEFTDLVLKYANDPQFEELKEN